MLTRHLFTIVCVLSIAPGVARAQNAAEQVQTIKRQMEQLQEQLQKLERPEKPNKGVTQIGSSRKTSPRETAMIVRIYDVSDLFAAAPSYEARSFDDLNGNGTRNLFPSVGGGAQGASSGMGGGMGGGGMGGGGGFFAVQQGVKKLPEAAASVLAQQAQAGDGKATAGRTSLSNLIEAITTTIAPQSWDDVGGTGSIAPIGNALLISNDESTHEQIEALLDLFRKRLGTLRTVSVRAYWLWLNDAQLSELVNEDGPAKKDEVQAYGLVDAAAWKKTMAAQRAEDSELPGGYRAIVTCYNGQTVHTAAGAQNLEIVDMSPETVQVSGKDETQIGYHPVTAVIQDGAALQVTPSVNTSGKFVVLDLHSRVTKRIVPEAAAAHPAEAVRRPLTGQVRPQELAAALDRPQVKSQRLSTTLRVPVNRTMLVGGMTFESEPGPADPSLYLFVRVSVQELRDDKPVAKIAPDAPASDEVKAHIEREQDDPPSDKKKPEQKKAEQ